MSTNNLTTIKGCAFSSINRWVTNDLTTMKGCSFSSIILTWQIISLGILVSGHWSLDYAHQILKYDSRHLPLNCLHCQQQHLYKQWQYTNKQLYITSTLWRVDSSVSWWCTKEQLPRHAVSSAHCIQSNPGPVSRVSFLNNIRSFTNSLHITAVADLADTLNIDVYALNDTWISPNTTSAQLIDAIPRGFTFINTPRPVPNSCTSLIVGGGTAWKKSNLNIQVWEAVKTVVLGLKKSQLPGFLCSGKPGLQTLFIYAESY